MRGAQQQTCEDELRRAPSPPENYPILSALRGGIRVRVYTLVTHNHVLENELGHWRSITIPLVILFVYF